MKGKPPSVSDDEYDDVVRELRHERAPRGGAKLPAAMDSPPWAKNAETDKSGRPIANIANTLACMRGTIALKDCFGFDEMLEEAVLLQELPLVERAKPASVGKLPRPITDADVTQMLEWVQHVGGMPRIGLTAAHDAVDRRAKERRFHPLRDQISNLQWDGTPRLRILFSEYFGAENSDSETHAAYLSKTGEMFLTGMVARVLKPGCKVDTTPVLIGPQGILKSSAGRILAGDEYFGDSLPDIHSKDASQYLRGKWLIEISELAAMNRSDIETIKAFLSRQEEKYRPSYGRKQTVEPRQCVFMGTTNQPEFLKDTTGNRRFWPIQTGAIKLDAIARDRNQLFAEAVTLFRKGVPWWPDRNFETTHIAPEQESRVAIDLWQEPIAIKVANLAHEISAHEIARDALGLEPSHMNAAAYSRIATIMKQLGWVHKRSNRARVYAKADW